MNCTATHGPYQCSAQAGHVGCHEAVNPDYGKPGKAGKWKTLFRWW